jgi:ribonuclease E
VGNPLDGSSGLWRKEAGGAITAGPAGPAATPSAKPRAQFTTLLQSLVETGNAQATKKDAAAADKEDAPRVAFWMAAPATAPQVSDPAKPTDGAADTQDGARRDDSPTAGQASAPETTGEAAMPVAKATPQWGAPLPVALATAMNPGPDTREEGAELPQAAAQAMENGAPDSKLTAGAGLAEQETAAGSQWAQNAALASTEAKSRPATGARPAAGRTPAGKQVAAEQETVAAGSDSLQALSAAPSQTQFAAGLPAIGQPAAKPGLNTDRPPRPGSATQSSAPGATGENGASSAGTGGGQPLAEPAGTGQIAAVSQPDARTAPNGGNSETAAAAGQSAANSVPAASELPDEATGSGAVRPMVVAFTARLRPVAALEAPSSVLAPQGEEPIETAPVSDARAAAGETGRAEREDADDTPGASTGQPDLSREPVRKPEDSAAAAPEPPVTARPTDSPQPLAAGNAQPRASAPASPPAAATEPAAAPEAPKPAAAHDIKLELAGQGDQRVEVRVSERAGDMHVDVRTPDSGLAGDLREDLPALASKLEQTGFRAETWHPAGTGERSRTVETAPGAASQNSERQPGQNSGQRQRDPQPQPKPKAQENDTPSPDAGKDFAWLFSSIQ